MLMPKRRIVRFAAGMGITLLALAVIHVVRARPLNCIQAIHGDHRGFPDSNSDCSVLVSRDGRYVYATHVNRSVFMTFDRREDTGKLRVKRGFQTDVGEPLVKGTVLHRDFRLSVGLASTLDGRFLFAGTCVDSMLAVFRHDDDKDVEFLCTVRDQACGDGTLDCVASPDGRHVYVSANWGNLCVFELDEATGNLTFVELFQDEEVGSLLSDGATRRGRRDARATILTGIMGPDDIAMSPDGCHLYVAARSGNAVTVFARDTVTGKLTHVQTIEREPSGVAHLTFPSGIDVMPDGTHVAVCTFPGRLFVFSRERSTGRLSLAQTFEDNTDGVDGLDYAQAVCVSPDGTRIYVAGCQDHAIAVFSRDPASGDVTFLDAVRSTHKLHRVRDLAISPDGKNLYAVSQDSGLAVFRVRDK